MIRGSLVEGEAVLTTRFPAGCVSYVDRDWLTTVEGPIPSISFAEGEVLWCEQPLGQLAAGLDPTVVAAQALLGVAREANAAVAACAPGTVEVVGHGLVAAYIRRLVGPYEHRSGQRPAAVVDTTGDPEAIRAALESVSDLGVVVLAGEPAGRMLDLDLYSSVHKRGLVLTGVAPPLRGVDVLAATDVDDEDLAFSRQALAGAMSEPIAGDALWYRVVA